MSELEKDYFGIEAGWEYIRQNPNATHIPFDPKKASRTLSLYLREVVDEENRAQETMRFDARFEAINSRRAQEGGAIIYLHRTEFEIASEGLLALKAERDQLQLET